MAISAFKSTSKRGNYGSSSSTSSSRTISSTKDHTLEDTGRKIKPSQRSRSVNAVSRSYTAPPLPSSSDASISEFSNKRDNPLYSSSSSPESGAPVDALKGSSVASGSRRGRAVSRTSGFGSQISDSRYGSSRSLSRVDTGRRLRSVSREPYENSEREVEHGYRSASSLRSKENVSFPNGQRKIEVTANDLGSEETRHLQTWTSRHPISESWDTSSSCAQTHNWEDGISTSSFSEAEEIMNGAVCESVKSFQGDEPPSDSGDGGIYETVLSEVRRAVSEIRNDLENAILSKNHAILTTENIVDISSELVNPDALELVSDIRREYATKLEQSQERARKLRADLAVEEQRGQELGRILNNVLPDPKSSDTRKSRPKRKASMERIKISRRLAEEAMNYFDECVSISTFDNSDFSSQEDAQASSVGVVPPMGSSRFFPHEGSAYLVSNFSNGHDNHHEELDNQTRCLLSIGGSDLAVSSSFSSAKVADPLHANGSHDDLLDFGTPQSGNSHFSFAPETMETLGVHDIRQYIKKFEKELRKESAEPVKERSRYNPDDYESISSAESLLFDHVILRNRIESGGLLLCNVRIF